MPDFSQYEGFSQALLYMPVSLHIKAPIQEVPRREARAIFKQLIGSMDERMAQLERLVATDIPGFTVEYTYECLDIVDEWFYPLLHADVPGTTWVPDKWVPVTLDIGLLMGEVLIRKVPKARWQMDTFKANGSYYHSPYVQCPVITKESNYQADYVANMMIQAYLPYRGDFYRKRTLAERVESIACHFA